MVYNVNRSINIQRDSINGADGIELDVSFPQRSTSTFSPSHNIDYIYMYM